MAAAALPPPVPPVAIAALPPPVPPAGGTSFYGRMWTIYNVAMSEGSALVKNVVKLISYGTFWKNYTSTNESPALRELGSSLGNFKNLLSAVELPSKAVDLAKKVLRLNEAVTASNLVEVGTGVCGLTNNVCDSIDYASTITPISSEVMKTVKGINFTATLLGAGKGTYDAAADVVKGVYTLMANDANNEISADLRQATATKEKQKIVINTLNVVSRVSYVALGAIGLASLSVCAMPAVAFVSCLTLGTVTGFTTFFLERVWDPSGRQARSLQEQLDQLRPVHV